ncbi:MAG: tetratricopeptide repeat protein, partial [Planktothrix sp.]|uniref:tetratricopeptide repeat protein n=1 Tax=Planktothrix sp. TaxID=3088171 RepID=UPI0038D5139C
QWIEAIEVYRQAIALNPDFSWSYHNLGTALIQQQKWSEAILAYSKAIELNPSFCWSYYYLGEAYAQLENWLEAVFAHVCAWKQKPDLLASLNRIGEIINRESLVETFHGRSLLKAVITSSLSQWQKFLPSDVELYVKLAKDLAQNHYEYAAIIFYHIALSIQPDNVEIEQQLNTILEQKSALEQEINKYSLEIQLNSNNPESYYNLGIALSRQQRTHEAVNAYLNFLELKPDIFLWNYQNIVDLIAHNNSLDTAINLYHQAIAKQPKSCILYLNLAVLLTQKGDLSSAIQYNYIAGQKIIPKFRPQWQLIANTLKPVNHLDFLIIGSQKG